VVGVLPARAAETAVRVAVRAVGGAGDGGHFT